ncbi:MAG: protein kinase [Gemmatimonadetes bacterium]|nr:protein kinase [Gemmatimonadota bacterium]
MSETLEGLKAALAGRYHIERELGQGGMAIVYLAEDLKHQRKVAVKVLRRELSAGLGAERFVREIQIAARLQHPHILPLYDSGDAGGILFYVMPFVEGESLRQRLKQKPPLSPGDALQLFTEIAGALDYAHAEGVVHRDLKPENILLSRGHAVIADFGIARAITAARGPELTAAGVAVGTPAYMSPEQIAGDRELDGRADQYALGCVLYEMLAGERPFTAQTLEGLMRQHLLDEPPSVTAARPDTPHSVASAIRRSLAKDPALRFASCGQFAGAVAGKTRMARTPPFRAPLYAAMIVVTAGAALWTFARMRDAASGTRMPRLAVLPFDNRGAVSDEYVADGITEAITTRLASIGDLRVISRQSVLQYKGSGKSLRQIAAELDVQYLLAGSLQRERPSEPASRVRVSPQLIRTSDETQPWAASYDVELNEVFRVYSEIADSVARHLSITLAGSVRRVLAERPTRNTQAYDYYLRGNAYFERRLSEPEARLAVEMYQRAVDADSMFADAFARLAYARAWLAWDFAGPEEVTRARQALDRAIALGPDRAEGQLAAGYLAFYGAADYPKALQQFTVLRERQPNNADVLTAIGLIHRRLGHWERAIEGLLQSLELSPRESFVAFVIGQTYGAMRRYDDAERYLDLAISIDPSVPQAYVEKAWLYTHRDGSTKRGWQVLRQASSQLNSASLAPVRAWFHVLDRNFDLALTVSMVVPTSEVAERPRWFVHHLMGDRAAVQRDADSARRVYDVMVADRPTEPQLHSYLGATLAVLGRADQALEAGRRATGLRPVSADAFTGPTLVWNLAGIHALLGDDQGAIAQLAVLADAPSRLDLPPLRLDPMWDRLRGTPGFERLLDRERAAGYSAAERP